MFKEEAETFVRFLFIDESVSNKVEPHRIELNLDLPFTQENRTEQSHYPNFRPFH